MAKILDFNCVGNFWQKVVVFIVSFDLRLFGFSLETYYRRGFYSPSVPSVNHLTLHPIRFLLTWELTFWSLFANSGANETSQGELFLDTLLSEINSSKIVKINST